MFNRKRLVSSGPIVASLIAVSALSGGLIAVTEPAQASPGTAAHPRTGWGEWVTLPTIYTTRAQATAACAQAHQWLTDVFDGVQAEIQILQVMVKVGTALVARFKIIYREQLEPIQ